MTDYGQLNKCENSTCVASRFQRKVSRKFKLKWIVANRVTGTNITSLRNFFTNQPLMYRLYTVRVGTCGTRGTRGTHGTPR